MSNDPMIIELSDEALEYGHHAGRAFQAGGGDELVQAAESDPNGRSGLVEPILGEIGALDLDPRGSADELEAAAALCRSAGYWVVPHPVAERLARPVDLDVGGLVVVSDVNPSGPVAGIDLKWLAVSVSGRRYLASPGPVGDSPRKSALVAELELEDLDDGGADDVALGLVLPCWTLLGMLDRALDLTRSYIQEREQFGRPLSAFQSVQFQLTETEVERSGFEMLAKYALWSIEDGRDEKLDDALALRLAAIEAADTVFRIAHQLHGAIGFCDETTLSWVSRYSQPIRRLPFGLSGTRDLLVSHVGGHGLSGIFR